MCRQNDRRVFRANCFFIIEHPLSETLWIRFFKNKQLITSQGHNPQAPNSSIALRSDTTPHYYIFPKAYVGKLFHQGKCLSYYTMETTRIGTSLREEYYKSV